MRENDLQKLREMIKDIDFCMMTTVDEDGDLHSRPMSVNGEVDPDGDLWFFTGASSHKVSEIEKLPKVNVSFADPENQDYVSISGTAQIVRDRGKIEELWKPELRCGFRKARTIRRSHCCASISRRLNTGTARQARLVMH